MAFPLPFVELIVEIGRAAAPTKESADSGGRVESVDEVVASGPDECLEQPFDAHTVSATSRTVRLRQSRASAVAIGFGTGHPAPSSAFLAASIWLRNIAAHQ